MSRSSAICSALECSQADGLWTCLLFAVQSPSLSVLHRKLACDQPEHHYLLGAALERPQNLG